MKNVAFATGSRADYGIMRRYLSLLNEDSDINLHLIVTGALLDNKYGHQVDLIYKDGFCVDAEISLQLDSSSDNAILHTMSDALSQFADYFSDNPPDLLIILGDRYEMLSVAIAAAMQKVPILHIHGGEATYGNYDEFIRHCITKMSLYHFTSTEEYRSRVIQLGENPARVFYLGALGAENCLYINQENVPKEIQELPYKKYFVVLFHPETLMKVNALDQINEILQSINSFDNYQFVFLGSNADTHSDVIRVVITDYVKTHGNAVYYENLHTDAYHYLVKQAVCLIGNSSSGIIEAPSLGVYTINIGDRQKGRVRGNSVIDVACTKAEIIEVITHILHIYKTVEPVNPYKKDNSAQLYYQTTQIILGKVSQDAKDPKTFYDIEQKEG